MFDLLNTRDVARLYHVTGATVLNWIRSGKLKAYTTPGGHYRVAREDLDAFSSLYPLPPTSRASASGLRVLLVGADADLFARLRAAIGFRWPAACVEHARSEFEIGWWMSRLHPTHLLVHPALTSPSLVDQCHRIVTSDASLGTRFVSLPSSPEQGLGEWIDDLNSLTLPLDTASVSR